MKANLDNFVEAVIILVPELAAIRERLQRQWNPDRPPPTILLGELGEALVIAFQRKTILVEKELWALIESTVDCDDEVLSSAVATGLLEGMVTAGDRMPKVWSLILRRLGTKSAEHAIAWQNFGQLK